jgi:hypothetical protein
VRKNKIKIKKVDVQGKVMKKRKRKLGISQGRNKTKYNGE